MNDVNVVIFQDYNKGVLTKYVIDNLVEFVLKKKIPTLADPKKENYWQYKGLNIFKPNISELIESNTKEEELCLENISKIVTKQRKQLNAKLFLLTMSEKGMFIQSKNEEHYLPAHKRKIIDVSGAGDAVIATAALALTQKLDHQNLAQLANLAGGLSCEKVGVNPVDRQNLLNEAIRLI